MLLEESYAAEGLDPGGSGSAIDQDIPFDNETGSNALIPLQYRISAATLSKVDEDRKMIQMTFMRKQWERKVLGPATLSRLFASGVLRVYQSYSLLNRKDHNYSQVALAV